MSVQKHQSEDRIRDQYKWLSIREFVRIDKHLSRETFFKVPRTCAQLLAVWPGDVTETKPKYLQTLVYLAIVGLAACTQWSYVAMHSANMNEVLTVTIPSSTLSVSLLKSLLLLLQKPKLRRVLVNLHHEWYISEYAKKYEKFIFGITKWAHILSIAVFFAPICVISFTTVIPIGEIFYQLATRQEVVRRLGFVSMYPFDITTEPGFEFALVFITAAAIYTVLSIVAIEGEFITMCMYIAANFRIVRMELDTLIKDEIGETAYLDSMVFTKEENDKILRKLSKIIQKHNNTIAVCNEMVSAFVPVIILHFLTAACILCACCIGILANDVTEGFVYLFHGSSALAQLMVYCAGGALILEWSTQISFAIYDFKWYKTDTRVRKTIQLMIMHSQNGTSVEVPFFEVSAPIFLTIFRTAGSYVALMKTFM